MRAKEFIVEYKKYPTEEYEGVTFTMAEEEGVLTVKALNDFGIPMGWVRFTIDDKELDPRSLYIDKEYRGQGVARVMYDYIKSRGFIINRSWDQTDAGAGFWNKHRGEERVWEDKELVKNRWALIVSDPEKHTWAPNLIDLVKNAYQNTSLGSFVQNASQVAASDWVALDWDPQPDLDCTVFYRRARGNEHWSGYKIQGIGHDGKPESKQKVISRVKTLLGKPGTWIESSDAMARTLGKLGMQPVTDEDTLNMLFPGTNLKILDQNGNYERDAGSSRIREQVFGNPVTK